MKEDSNIFRTNCVTQYISFEEETTSIYLSKINSVTLFVNFFRAKTSKLSGRALKALENKRVSE